MADIPQSLTPSSLAYAYACVVVVVVLSFYSLIILFIIPFIGTLGLTPRYFGTDPLSFGTDPLTGSVLWD